MINIIVELFIFFEIVTIVFFITSFFTKQEILWAITAVLSAMLMYTSYFVETYKYVYNETSKVYDPVSVSYSYPYLMAVNLIFFAFALLLGFFDIFDKYGTKFWKH